MTHRAGSGRDRALLSGAGRRQIAAYRTGGRGGRSSWRRTQQFVSGETAAAYAAVLLSAVTNRADEYLTPTPGTQEQSGVVHGPPGEEGWTIRDHRAILHSKRYASADLGAASDVDGQVLTVRGCVGLFAESDLTPTPGWRHFIDARAKRPWPTPSARTRETTGPKGQSAQTIQRTLGGSSAIASRPMCTVYAHFPVATNKRRRSRGRGPDRGARVDPHHPALQPAARGDLARRDRAHPHLSAAALGVGYPRSRLDIFFGISLIYGLLRRLTARNRPVTTLRGQHCQTGRFPTISRRWQHL